ncbi:MAG: 6-phosphogluconolactonase [Desulfobulbaceae bacterium]|nr:6-phosphogluconolactonase [Desulfobulbaceae bacterium]
MHTYRCFTGPDEAAGVLAEELQALSLAQEVSHIVLSGGSTPQHWFALMAQPPFARTIRWSALHFWWGDERCVAPEDSTSNYGQAEQLLLRHVAIPAANIHRIRGENEPRSEALRLEAELRALVPQQQGRPVFDWVLLGMGADGHTASLFPQHTDFDEERLAIVATHPQSGQLRISLSALQLASCRRLTFLVLGTDKAERIGEIFTRPAETLTYPAARISAAHGVTEWYLDAASAAHLQGGKA